MTPTNNQSGDLERVSVPREPTEAMLDAGRDTLPRPFPHIKGWPGIYGIYEAMIAAAPARQARQQGGAS